MVEDTYRDIRIYVILGNGDNHLGLLDALYGKKLLQVTWNCSNVSGIRDCS